MNANASPSDPLDQLDQDAARVLDFWFGPLDDTGRADAQHAQRWWRKDEAFDARIRDEFGQLHARWSKAEPGPFLAAPRTALALTIVLDQFSRNMFRGTPASFASDARALDVAERAVAAGFDRALPLDHRAFLYMPFMHSEQLAMQDRCVELFSALRDELSGKLREDFEYQLDFAIRHRVIVERYGRFPHRNAILGRTSTEAELEFLKTPGSSF
jgi:uncharacterized protein (DUF924 family)